MSQALAKYVHDRKKFSESEDRNSMELKWGKAIRAYNNYIKSSYPGHSKINIPETFATTYRISAAINTDIAANRDIVQYVAYPKTPQDGPLSEMAAEPMQGTSNYYINKTNALRDISSVILEAVTLGTSHTKTTWEYSQLEGASGTITTKDNPRIEHRPLKNIYLDPKIIPTQRLPWEGEYVVDASYVSFDSLTQNPRFSNLDAVKKKTRAKRSTNKRLESSITRAYDTALSLGTEGVELRDSQSDRILLEEYWGLVPRKLLKSKRKTGYEQSDLRDFILSQVILAEGVVIFAEESPYHKIPYDVFRCYPRTSFYYGIGVPELIYDLQRVLNGIVNQRIDNVSLHLNKLFVYRGGMVNPKLLVSRPGGAIPVTGDVNTSVKVLETGDVTQSSYIEQQHLQDYIGKITGASAIFFGETDPGEQTATEIGAKVELGAGMIQEIVSAMVRDGFVPMMEKWRDLILSFQSEPLSILVGGAIQTINPEDLDNRYELIPTIGDRMFTKQAEFSKAAAIMQLTAPLVEGGLLPPQILEKLYERLYKAAGYKDFESIKNQAQAGSQGLQQAPGGVQGNQTSLGSSGIPPELVALAGGIGGEAQ